MTNFKIISQDVKIRSETPLKEGQAVTAYTPTGMKTYNNSATGTYSGSHLYLIFQD